MIREKDLATFLSSVAAELQNSIRPNLTSGMALKSVDSIDVMLGRLVAQLLSGDEIAGRYKDQWNELSRTLPVGSKAAADSSPAAPIQHLMNGVDSIQHQLIEPASFNAFVELLKRGDAPANAWLKQSTTILYDMWRKLEDSYYRPPRAEAGAEARPDDPESIKKRLGVYLAKKYKGLDEHCVESLRLIPGGQAKRTVLFQLTPNDALPSKLVMRQDMENSLTGTVVTDEFDILKRVYALGIPLPEPILLEADPAPMGGCFLIMREAEGAVPAGTYFPEERAILGHAMGPRFGVEVAAALAKLHGLTLTQGATANGEDEDEARMIDKLQAEWRAGPTGALSIAMDIGLAWMRANPLGNRPCCLIHGDVGAHNMMSKDGHLAALLDWELAKPGDPAEDLAQAMMMLLPDIMPWEEFAKAYIEQGGPAAACDARAVGYYAVRTYIKHGILNFRLWRYFVAGKRTDAAAASVASHWVDRIMLYLSRALESAVKADPQR